MTSRFDPSRMVRRAARGMPEWWYHVTYNGRLPSIADEGLRRGQERSIGAGAYDSHAAKGVFLTEADGVFYWHSTAEAFAEHDSDNIVEDELIPVVLRVKLRRGMAREDDVIGTQHSGGHKAIIVRGPILPSRLTVWTGKKWVPIEQYHLVDERLGFYEEPQERDEEDEESWSDEPDVLYYFADRSLLIPPECRK